MPRRLTVPSLYYYSLQSCCTLIIPFTPNPVDGMARELIFDTYPAHIVTDLMETAFTRRCEYNEDNKRILFAPTLRTAIITWSIDDFELLVARCPKLAEVIAFWEVHVGDDIKRDINVISLQRKVKRLIFLKPGMESFFLQHIHHSESGRFPTLYTYIPFIVDRQFMRRKLADNSSFDMEIYFDMQELSCTEIITILKNCDNVGILKHHRLFSALRDLHEKATGYQEYNIRNLESGQIYIPPESLTKQLKDCIRTCNKVRFVDFYKVTVEDVSPFLLSLNSLEALRLENVEIKQNTNEILYSILDKHGQSLRYLAIDVPEGLDVDRLLSSCCNLEHLELTLNRESFSITDDCLKLIPRLRRLVLSGLGELTDASSSSKLLMCNTLVSLELYDVIIDSTAISSAIVNGCWRNLAMLFVFDCEGFKIEHVMDLLEAENELALLMFILCTHIAHEKEIIQKKIADLMLGVQLTIW